MLVAHVLGMPRSQLFRVVAALEGEQAMRFQALLERRLAGEPLAYLEGTRGFWGLELAVDPRVLIPRPDSETLIELAVQQNLPEQGVVLDLGTGSGALLLAFLSERPAWTGVGVDRSSAALEVARGNAGALGFDTRARFVHGDWAEGLAPHSADLVLCNPPYIEPGEALGPGVEEHEPASALFTKEGDPYGPYTRVLTTVQPVLRPGGCLIFEVGDGRADGVAQTAASLGWTEQGRRRDLGGIERALAFAPVAG